MSLSMVEAAQHVLWGNVADMNGASVLQEHSAVEEGAMSCEST